MNGHPTHANRKAYAYLAAQLTAIETNAGLLHGAIAIALDEMSDIDPGAVEQEIDDLARRIRQRVRGGSPRALLAQLHEALFVEEGFHGDTEVYYHRFNSYLPKVLETKRGLPITLSLVYKLVAERLGLKVLGVGAPGHFMAAVHLPGDKAPMLVDPFFGGRIVSIAEAVGRVATTLGVTEDPPLSPEDALPVVTHRL